MQDTESHHTVVQYSSLKVAYRLSEVAKALGIGLTHARKLVASGAIASVRVGKCVLVTEEAMRAFLASAAVKGGV